MLMMLAMSVNLNRSATIAAKKISNKSKNIRRKRKRCVAIGPIEGPVQRSKTSIGSKESTVLAAKKISDKYKKMRNK